MNNGMPTLHRVRALVTRPEPQASQLANVITDGKGRAVVMPMINISPLPKTQQSQNTILNLDRYDKVIVISRPAARIGLEWLEQYWPQFPIHLEWFAIGSSTASELAEYMISPLCSNEGSDSEALLAMPELQAIRGNKVLIIKGCGGRERLQQELQAREAKVDTLEVYQRERSEYSQDELVKQLESNHINVILCGSGETVTHLGHYLPEPNRPDYLLIVPSERVARHALALGFRQVHNANGASNNAMLSALADTI